MNHHNHTTIIDNNKIWKLIARGWDFTVYHYGKDQVIKYSRLSLLFWMRHTIKLTHDYTICKRYLKKYIVETNIIWWDSQYIELQNYIKWTPLHIQHSAHKKITTQIKDILEHINHMQKDWYAPIDLIGIPWLFGKSFANILVDQDFNLKIIDATLLESKSTWILWYMLEPIMWLAIKIQHNKLMKLMKLMKKLN